MIPREVAVKLVFFFVTTIHVVRLEESRVYDTSEWIPIEKSCASCEISQQRQSREAEKRIEDRALNVANSAPHFKEIRPRFKKSNYGNEKFYYTLPVRHLPKRQQSYSNINIQNDHRQQLNERENVRPQFYTPQLPQTTFLGPIVNKPYQGPPLIQPINRPNPQEFPQQILLPAGPQYFSENQPFLPPQPLINASLLQNPDNPSFFQQNFKNPPQLPISGTQFIRDNNVTGVNNLIFRVNGPDQVLSVPPSNIPPNVPLPKPETSKDNVQLLYVPFESLNQKQPQNAFVLPNNPPGRQILLSQNQPNSPQGLPNPQIFPQFNQQPYQFLPVPSFQPETPLQHKQHQLQNIQNDFARQALEALKLQLQLESNAETAPQPTTTTVSTPTTVKRKSHQPPLAVYMGGDERVSISDVLQLLKDARNISVQDEIGPDSPQVFVGPGNLQAPEGYHKFELPYLNNIENNRIERKVDQLPFFVAPLSYRAPSGYSKIPLPAPHVGSVVISQKEKLHEKNDNSVQKIQPPIVKFQDYSLPYNPNKVHSQRVKPENYNTLNNQNFNVYKNTPVTVSTTLKYPSTIRPDPLSQTINQFELEQINNQFVPQFADHSYSEFYLGNEETLNKATQNNDPSQMYNYSEHFKEVNMPQTTQAVPVTTQRNLIATHRISESTQSNSDKKKYTVLEDFFANSRPESTTSNYLKSNIPIAQPLQADSVFSPTPKPQNVQQIETVSLTQGFPNTAQNYFQLNSAPYLPYEENLYRPFHQQNDQKINRGITPASVKLLDNPTTASSQTNYNINEGINFYQSEDQRDSFKITGQLPPDNSNLHNLINSLQDQSLRPLLVPASIAPTTEDTYSSQLQKQQQTQQKQYQEMLLPQLISNSEVDVTPNSQAVESATSSPVVTSSVTTTEKFSETTTPFRKQRGRQRARSSTTTNSPNRTRKPASRSRTQTRYQPEQSGENYSPIRQSNTPFNKNSEEYGTKVNRGQYRVRTRTRTSVQQVEEKTTTYKPSETERVSRPTRTQVSTISPYRQPQSYMQFEQPLEYSKENPDNSENTVPSTERQFLQESVIKHSQTENEPQQQMNVDVIINHPIIDQKVSNSDVQVTTPLYQTTQENISASRVNFRSRVRTKTKKRTTTPPTTETISYVDAETKSKEEEEFYGFIRAPNYSRPVVSTNAPKLYSATYSANTLMYAKQNNNDNTISYQNQDSSNPTRVFISSTTGLPQTEFAGKIIPKYTASANNDEESITEISSPASRKYTIHTSTQPSTVETKTKIRGRMRIPVKKLYTNRGKTHYQPPNSVKTHTSDEDVEGGNYPESFLQKQKLQTERPKLQITVDPEDAEVGDQEPHPSIYVSKVLRGKYHHDKNSAEKLNTINTSTYVNMEKKTIESQEQPVNQERTTNVPVDENKNLLNASEEQQIDAQLNSITVKPRRRGVWRLIKRPVDGFHISESQNVANVFANNIVTNDKTSSFGKSINSDKVMIVNSIPYYKDAKEVYPTDNKNFNNIVETTAAPIITTTQKDDGMIESLFDMFKFSESSEERETSKESLNSDSNSTSQGTIPSLTTFSSQTEPPITTIMSDVTTKIENTATDFSTTQPSSQNDINENSEVIDLSQDTQTEADLLKTSVSTEVSHETEICYRGRCIKTDGPESEIV